MRLSALFWKLASLASLIVLSSCDLSAGDAGTEPGAFLPTASPFVFPPTFTPGLALDSAPSQTPRATHTPVPTSTQPPTLLPSATPHFEIAFASVNDQPIISYSLLFFDGSQLRIWDHLNGQVNNLDSEVLPAHSLQVSTSSSGLIHALAATTDSGFEIMVYNTSERGLERTIQVDGQDFYHMALSPDGRQIAFVARDASSFLPPAENTPEPELTPTPGEPAEASPTPQPSPQALEPAGIYLVDTQGSDSPVRAVSCGEGCTEIIWDPAGQAFVWGQDDGLWQLTASPEGPGQPVRLLEPFLEAVSGSSQDFGRYFPISFSPSGRFLLVRKGIEGSPVIGLVDTENRTVENLPGTGEYTGSRTDMAWLPGDVLLIARPGVARLSLLPGIELWRVVPSAETMFGLLADYPIPGDFNTVPAAPVQLPDGRLGFTLQNYRDSDDPGMNGLFLLDPAGGAIVQANFLPLMQVDGAFWLPDGSGALVISESRVLFVPAGFSQIYSVSSLLGPGICCFKWLP